MGFNVFASGSGHFHYKKNDFIDGDDFNTMKVVHELGTLELSKSGVVNAVVGHKTPGITDLMETVATKEFLHTLNDSVCLLAMCSGVDDGWISVSCTESHTLWPETKSFARYSFSPGDSPGAEFIKAIGPALKQTNLNSWGVLLALSIVVSLYSSHVGQNATPMLNITLSH